MATVIDALVVELGLDPKKFNQGQRDALSAFKQTQEAALRGAKEVEQQGKRVTEFFTGLKREALGLLGAFVGGRGIKEFVSYVTNVDAATGRLAKRLDLSTEALSAWQGVGKLTGSTAEDIAGSMQAVTSELNKFQLTGQSSLVQWLRPLNISLFDSNKKLKTASDLFLEISERVQGMDPARASAILSALGIGSGTTNTLLQGPRVLRELLDEQVRLGVITREDGDAAIRLDQSWKRAEQSATSLGRTILTALTPALEVLLDRWTQIFTELRAGEFISHDSLLGRILGKQQSHDAAPSSPSPASAPASSAADVEAYIRQAAIARGIDPNVAVAVAKSEGLNSYIGDRGSSFGPFQLHYGGVASGGMAVGGLGDEFTKKTGLDARDPSTVRQQIDFALDQARTGGWGPWHGWRGLPNAGIGGFPGAAATAGVANDNRSNSSSSSSVTTIQNLNVITRATDGEGIARDIKPALERNSFAAQANYGPQ